MTASDLRDLTILAVAALLAAGCWGCVFLAIHGTRRRTRPNRLTGRLFQAGSLWRETKGPLMALESAPRPSAARLANATAYPALGQAPKVWRASWGKPGAFPGVSP